jgi:GAF domain-containing protein
MIWKFLSPPLFDTPEQNYRARFVNGFSWTAMALTIAIAIIIAITGYTDYTLYVLIGLVMVFALTIILLRSRFLNASTVTLVVLTWLGIFFQASTADGVHDVIIIAFIATALFASILIGWWAGGLTIFASILGAWLLASLEANQLITPTVSTPYTFARDLTFILLIIYALILFSTRNLQNAIDRAKASELNARKSNEDLQKLNTSLGDRIAESTAELVATNQRNERRARQFEAIAQVAHATTTNQNLETLLPKLVELISKQFDFYHIGIFLLDENKEFAELRAANSEGGKRMLERRHKLGIGQSGIVGFVSATGKPRIALDVGADAAFFNNPDLPSTRSEMALPLRVADQIIGVLDVQSIAPNAFQEEDIDVLSTLADQVSIAIQNARSFEISQELLAEAQKTSGAFLRESWRVLQTQEESLGYQITDNKLKPLSKPVSSAQIKKAMTTKATVTESGEHATLSIPIRLRNTVIGVMDIRVPDEHEWDTDEIDVAEAVAERLSLALEASLLLKSTQRQAEIERITADISTKIGATTQFDSILRTAAEELSRVLGGSEVLVQLQSSEVPNERN